MADGPTPKKPRGRRPRPTEFRFWIDAYSPRTIPMARLAEYMVQLATMLGEENAVHFVKLEPGSTSIVHRIQDEALPKVRDRARAIRARSAPRDALRAYETVNRMLREDNGTGAVKDSDDVIIPFPGRENVEEKYVSIRQHGSIDGKVMRIGGPQKWVPIILQSEEEAIAGCWADRLIAKRLGLLLFEPVRLHGYGKWNRDANGKWSVQEFIVESFEALNDEPLSEAVGRLRSIGAFSDVTADDIEALRREPQESANGGT